MHRPDARCRKKLTAGEVTDSTPASYRQALIGLKRSVCKTFGWSLHDVDETDINNLLAFIEYTPAADPNVRVIKGKTYTRATKPPAWL